MSIAWNEFVVCLLGTKRWRDVPVCLCLDLRGRFGGVKSAAMAEVEQLSGGA